MSVAEETEAGYGRPEDRLPAVIAERAGAARADAARSFARAYLRRLSGDASDGISDEDLVNEVLGALAFASARDGEAVAVRALNPTRDGHGYEPLGSVLETNTEDLPFLVDSVTAEVEARGLCVVRLRHPIVGVQRAPGGRIVAIQHPRDAARRESVMHFDLDRRLGDDELRDLEAGVRRAVEAVRASVRDFPAMTRRVEEMAELARAGSGHYPSDEVREVADFLGWLLRGNFVLLGAREYAFADGRVGVVDGSGLGILAGDDRSAFAEPVPLDALPPAVRERVTGGELLIVSKTNAMSPVHRRERMDYVGVRRVGPDGESLGESRLLGLFTTKAYAEPASETPVLHRKLRQALEAEDLIEGSHDYKAAVAVFDSFPKDELFAAPVDDLHRAVVSLMELEGSDRVRLLGRRELDGRSASLIVSVPRERYDPRLIERLHDLFRERFATPRVTMHHVLEEGERVRVHFSVHDAGGLPDVVLSELEAEVVSRARTWDDELRARLLERHGPGGGRALAESWAPHFPDHYKGYTSPVLAAHDVACLDRLRSGESFVVSLQPIPGGTTRLAFYKEGEKVELSEAMPMLEDLGLRVLEEISTRLVGEDVQTWVQEFRVLGPDGEPLDLEAAGERVAEVIAAVHFGLAESDTLNRLVLAAGLDRRQLAILRAYRKYRQRVGTRFTEAYQNDVLAANPGVTAKLVRYFEQRFDTAHPRDEAAEDALREEILADLDEVASLDHDRILRNQLAVIDATLRTNAYREDRSALAFKLRSADVPALPQPAPVFEIYVYSPAMEGIHLRGAKIARGGIRWSDRMDYRTEVFGLMRAQLTKNAIIVPAGAKGGFLLKQPPADRDALRTEVRRQYVSYIRSLLDVTDNLVDGAVVHPVGVRVLDEDDTYLVVAADKGTATFSDLANSVAQEAGFWLDDAFASGGSSGYDHKKLGITARGAWESVRRHFRELDRDPERDEITVVGIGDMSGDVFGNGMLLSRTIRLIGAYDHRHVFLDPDPDAAASFEERRRLFELGQAGSSSWDDYDRELISEGGGVYSRTAKSIPLSPQVRAALGVEEERLAPTDVIRAILRAEVDLLWNGGIGTVVKASTESDADAADRSSDAIRVDARQLRARVVGEGGNLGFTRRARVEYAAGGGLINADFIDNSAGVDCSDHEVNLKVLLGLAERRGEMTRAERDELLLAVTDDVVGHVLYDSFLQAQIIAQEFERSGGRMFAYEDLMALLEERGMLDRASEDLPTSEVITERRRAGRGMERPELAVLVAYAKRWVARELEGSDYLEDPWLRRDLEEYFPDAVVARCGQHLDEHPLRSELLRMINANSVVNSLGPTFVSQLVSERGSDVAGIVRAYRIAREVIRADDLWSPIERLEGIDRAAQAELMNGVDALVEATTRWYAASPPQGPLEEIVRAGREGFDRYQAVLARLGGEERERRRAETQRRLADAGVPEPLARAHALRPELVQAPDITRAAAETGRTIEDVAEAYFVLGEALQLEWMERELARVRSATRMQRWALQAVREDAAAARREVVQRALREGGEAGPREAVERFLAARADAARGLAELLRSLAREGDPDLAGFMLAVRQLRALYAYP